jgi:hypothetical protein
MAGDDFDTLAGQRPGQQTAGVPAKRVIASQGIAVADDQGEVRSQETGVRSVGGLWLACWAYPDGSISLAVY